MRFVKSFCQLNLFFILELITESEKVPWHLDKQGTAGDYPRGRKKADFQNVGPREL